MSFFDSNRLLWVAVLIGLGSACYTVPVLLQRVKDAARAPPPDSQPPPKRLQKDSENSLKVETLRTLADGHSYELRTSAIKIVASRTIRSGTKNLLFRDLASDDYLRRDNAINALWMLLYHPALNDAKLSHAVTDFRAVSSVVQALIHVLPLHRAKSSQPGPEGHKLPPSPLRPAVRPAHEGSLLIILNHLLRQHISSRIGRDKPYAMDHALRAGLVTQWLSKYPFPCSLPENSKFNFKRSDVARLCERSAWGSDDHLMADIVKEVMAYPLGRKQMLDAGLKGGNYMENVGSNDGWTSRWHASAWDDDDHDVLMTDGEDTAGLPLDGSLRPPPTNIRPRSVERSREAEHLRRRHREAIVVAERGTPLSRENILQRDNGHFGLQPMNGVSEAEGMLNNLLNLSDPQQFHDQDSEVEALDVIAFDPFESASGIEYSLNTREIEQLLEESVGDPDLLRSIERLSALEDDVIVLASGSDSDEPTHGAMDEVNNDG